MCVEVVLPYVVVIRPVRLRCRSPGAAHWSKGLATDRGQSACGRLALVRRSGGRSAEGLGACQVHVPVNPDRSMPNDALQLTAFGRS